jgi:hypothetical protein
MNCLIAASGCAGMSPPRGLFWKLIFLLLLFGNSCGQHEKINKDTFLIISRNGDFDQVEDLTSLPSPVKKPWPLQPRVTDISYFQGHLILAVNGFGIAELLVAPEGIQVRKLYNKKYFQGRTTTIVIPYQETLYCHVYSNTSFLSESPGTSGREAISFVKIGLKGDGAEFIPFQSRFQQGKPGWESVLVRTLDRGKLAIQWKLERKNQSAFLYSTLDLAKGEETEKDAGWFENAFQMVSLEKANIDPSLRAFLQAISGELRMEAAKYTVFYTVHDLQNGTECHYYFSSEKEIKTDEAIFYSILVMKSENRYTVLFADGRIRTMQSGNDTDLGRDRLPRLPVGFSYTDFMESTDFFCAAWEQIDFYRVGHAGILIRRK